MMNSKGCFNAQTSNQLSRAVCVVDVCNVIQIPSLITTEFKNLQVHRPKQHFDTELNAPPQHIST